MLTLHLPVYDKYVYDYTWTTSIFWNQASNSDKFDSTRARKYMRKGLDFEFKFKLVLYTQ